MTRPPISDESLRRAHAELWAARAGARGVEDIPIETVQALAAGTYQGSDRVELLDRVLAHPVTARELQVFGDLAAMAPVQRPQRSAGLWALAASVLLAVGVASEWGVRSWWVKEEVRGGGGTFALIEPAPDQPPGKGTRFLWRSATGATSYRLELVDSEGTLAFSVATLDTMAVLPDSVTLAPGTYQARVSATLRDGTEEKTPAARVTVR